MLHLQRPVDADLFWGYNETTTIKSAKPLVFTKLFCAFLFFNFKEFKSCNEYIELIDEIPGMGRRSAERIIAETGIVMTQFRNADHFASWAGLVPGCNESAEKKLTNTKRQFTLEIDTC